MPPVEAKDTTSSAIVGNTTTVIEAKDTIVGTATTAVTTAATTTAITTLAYTGVSNGAAISESTMNALKDVAGSIVDSQPVISSTIPATASASMSDLPMNTLLQGAKGVDLGIVVEPVQRVLDSPIIRQSTNNIEDKGKEEVTQEPLDSTPTNATVEP